MTPERLVPETGDTIPELLLATAKRAPERPALWRYVDAKFEPVTYCGLINAAYEIAQRLSKNGVVREQQIALAVTDRFAWGVCFLGILFTGSTAVPLDPLLMIVTKVVGRMAGGAFFDF